MASYIERRKFLSTLGGAAAAWPLAAHAQQRAMPVIGFLNIQSPDAVANRVRGFRQGLKDVGYVEGENVMIEYRWAEGRFERLPALAAELVRRQVVVIVAANTASALVAKAMATTIPIVFNVAEDPVKLGLVASLARPGGNLTGANSFIGELAAKRLELLRELLPGVTRVTALVNPTTPLAESALKDIEPARAMGMQIKVLNASTSGEINAAFATFVHERPDALFVSADSVFTTRRVQLVHLATRYAVPASYFAREFPEVGGLMSYGSNQSDNYRQVGIYTSHILKGTKPADLPVVQASKFELVINAETARTFGLTVPPGLLVAADEVIE
jgi:putative tryptophan/tyrosine transport system substrate-binding protein